MSRSADHSQDIEDSDDARDGRDDEAADESALDEDDLPLGDKRSSHALFDFGDDELADFDDDDFDDEFDDDFEEEDEDFAAAADATPDDDTGADFSGFGVGDDEDDEEDAPLDDED